MKKPNCDSVRFREELIRLRAELLQLEQTADEATQTVELDQSRVGRLTRMDALRAQAMSIEAKRRRTLNIQRIDAALQRLDNGKFGLCVRCGQEIEPKRLEFDLTTPLCIDCANEAEK